MKYVIVGVLLELLALASILLFSLLVPAGLPLGLYVVFAQLMATYLVHCPAHFGVGTVVGVRFRELRLGRTTLARVLPIRAKSFARLLPVLTLRVDRSSLTHVSRGGLAAMYASGTVASAGSAAVIACAATLREQPSYALMAWAVAVTYLAFDVVFSPKGGDLMRAKAALAASPLRESLQA
jgi:hypothetical protein